MFSTIGKMVGGINTRGLMMLLGGTNAPHCQNGGGGGGGSINLLYILVASLHVIQLNVPSGACSVLLLSHGGSTILLHLRQKQQQLQYCVCAPAPT